MLALGAGAGLCVVLTFLIWRAVLVGDLVGRERTYGTIFGVGCAVVTLLAIFALVGTTFQKDKMAAVAVDHFGVWWVFRGQAILTPWQSISAVATSYKRPPRIPFGRPRLRLPQDYAFEVYLHDPSLPDRPDSEGLRRFLVSQEPLRSGLSPQRLRFMLPMAQMRNELFQAVSRHSPGLWIGEYRRKWTRLPGT